MSAAAALEPLVGNVISVITNDGRNIVGVLKGFDQTTNLILDDSHERVYSSAEGVVQHVLGVYLIRGDTIAIVGELDEDLDAQLELDKIKAAPLKPVQH
uniref:U6 snRNA-associated Sm-like protein LSm8 n=1 Tax=Prasinoderma coloniale TaxID=156133 RepID=A0A7R9TR73_9VIRI|eukprot:PRCOL_00004091-RA